MVAPWPNASTASTRRASRSARGCGCASCGWPRLRREAQATYERLLAEQQNAQAEAALAQAAEGAEPAGSVVAVGEGELATGPPAVRFDLLATDGMGSPFLWRLLATYNEVNDPLRVEPGTVLSVPPGLPGSGAGRARPSGPEVPQ